MTLCSHPTEEWRPVPGFEGLYEVSSFGSVRSLRFDPPRHIRKGHDSDGYPMVWLYKGGKRTGRVLHRIVCRVFHGERPDELRNEVAHLDGARTNARADNLKWCGKVENHSHKRAHGTHQVGERHPRALLTDADVLEIRASREIARVLAGRYAVSRHTIADVRRRKTWGHVPDPIARGER